MSFGWNSLQTVPTSLTNFSKTSLNDPYPVDGSCYQCLEIRSLIFIIIFIHALTFPIPAYTPPMVEAGTNLGIGSMYVKPGIEPTQLPTPPAPKLLGPFEPIVK